MELEVQDVEVLAAGKQLLSRRLLKKNHEYNDDVSFDETSSDLIIFLFDRENNNDNKGRTSENFWQVCI